MNNIYENIILFHGHQLERMKADRQEAGLIWQLNLSGKGNNGEKPTEDKQVKESNEGKSEADKVVKESKEEKSREDKATIEAKEVSLRKQ